MASKRKTLKSQIVIEYEQLLRAIEIVQHKKGKNLLEHFVEKAFCSESALFALMHKLLANKQTPLIDQSKHNNQTFIVKWKEANEEMPNLRNRVKEESMAGQEEEAVREQ